MSLHEAFNRSAASRFLNSPAGRIFRVVAGMLILVVGLRFRHNIFAQAAMIWGAFALAAGGFDVCFISVALGGPFHGSEIRKAFGTR